MPKERSAARWISRAAIPQSNPYIPRVPPKINKMKRSIRTLIPMLNMGQDNDAMVLIETVITINGETKPA